jgi:hypothetical protein
MIPKNWLTHRLDPDDPAALAADTAQELAWVGVQEKDQAQLLARGPSPAWQEKWNAFLGAKAPDDELWRFRSPPETWRSLRGCAGYAVVRDGEVVDTLRTLVS